MEKEGYYAGDKRDDAHGSELNARDDPIENQNRTEDDAGYV